MSGRFDVFHSLDSDKQQRIISAALIEFAEKGFKRASTNIIAEQAKIGKGMLFYYFGNKEELFNFLCEYAIAFARDTYARRFDGDCGDFLERYNRVTEIKRRAMSEFPEVTAFAESMYRAENAPYTEKFAKEAVALREMIHGGLYDGIDRSLFREDIGSDMVVNCLKWLIDGYTNDLTLRVQNGNLNTANENEITAEWAKYYGFVADLRKIFYK